MCACATPGRSRHSLLKLLRKGEPTPCASYRASRKNTMLLSACRALHIDEPVCLSWVGPQGLAGPWTGFAFDDVHTAATAKGRGVTLQRAIRWKVP